MSSIVIIGAGECGGRTALQLRERNFDGTITLVGAEALHPYERPPLSKNGILEGADPKFIMDAEGYKERGIDVRLSANAIGIDRSSKTVELSDGTTLAYDKLLLATGARPRPLPGIAERSERVLTLRTHADALAIKRHLHEGSRLAIVGGGFIGLELAAIARGLGATVTLIEGLARILSRGVPEDIAHAVASRHKTAGVEILCESRIETFEIGADGVSISLTGGRTIDADIAVIGIGSIPNVELAEKAGLTIENGIMVDDHLRTSDPDIFAAGDCCSFPIPVYGGRRVRLESWRSAQEQAMLAAANLMGADERITAVPWFWSDQYELTLQVAGLAEGAVTSVRREVGEGAFIIFQIGADGRLLSASGIGPGNGIARDIRLAEMLIASGKTVDPAALAQADIKLKSLLAA
ncbi:NAD(P)/FAD-dependent oxidoreductase [Rhizobium sp. NPDC090275]|uniref:NAD(P)/FAD-dependent oxidoreductase n=1 Tax=Rhizobium sp. NPDC090275 TaxID=3364498 RepID=UPI00383B8554